ncbi:16S rRNA (cytosine(1402)-N(4))-methyltransferase RsmH [Gammaproteobacteria bacterium]|nr:16S rRNA (cytosine(1402)-N(4))-methyltransferase RsmH [Gammaproteobacteria bacterium]
MHKSVMLSECLEGLDIKANGLYIDATYGRGGHSQAILNRLGDSGRLICVDQDIEAIRHAQAHIAKDQRVRVVHQSFSHIKTYLSSNDLLGKVDGILMDVGVSSPQLDQQERGFSFRQDGPLDMRMNQSAQVSAYEYLMQVDEHTLADVIYELGEERHSRRVAKTIIQARQANQLENSTLCLANLVIEAGVKKDGIKHPATRTFQAIRMVVNQELDELEKLLEDSVEILKVGGKMVTISFHGLEHRVIKSFIRRYKLKDGQHLFKLLNKLKPSASEVRENRRARSAYVRVMEKLR